MKFFLFFLVSVSYSSVVFAANVSAVLRLNYKTNSHFIDSSQQYIVDNLFSLIEKFQDSRIYIIGHTDDRGSDEYNLILSKKRSQVVYNLVIEKGVAVNRLDVSAMGETAPIADNKLASGRSVNRRVVVTFTNLDSSKSAQLIELIKRTDGIDLIKEKSEKEESYIAEKESKVLQSQEYIKEMTSDEKTKEQVKPKKNIVFIEVNSLHNELRFDDKNSSTSFNELLSEVKTSVNLNFSRLLSKRFLLDLNLNIRMYGYAKELDFNITRDQEDTIVNFGVGFQHLTSAWLRNELLLRQYKQLYLRNTMSSNLIDWSLKFSKTLRLDWKPVFILLNRKQINLELSPVLSLFSKSLSGDKVSSGYALGGDLISYFLWKKQIGFGVRYQRAYFDSEQNTVWDITHENLELGIKLKFAF